MVLYRREKIPGGTWFFTVTLNDRRSKALLDHVVCLLRAYREVAHRRRHHTHALVIMPDHLHAIWTLPEGDSDFSSRWAVVKRKFVAQLPNVSASPWQSRFWEHRIRNDVDFARHVDYIHYNPVKHGYVVNPTDWRWSTVHRYVRQGWIPRDWAAIEGSFGESPGSPS